MNDISFQLSDENWSRLQELLSAALEQPSEVRASYLRQACESDPALHREAESLLDAHTRSGDFLNELEASGIATLLEDDGEWIDRDVGPYRITRLLGMGGMGAVYLAHDTRLERRVAVKFLPAWLATNPAARRQLVAEARAAAALDHPHIGIVYDIGETDEGQPFIAMAYYDGETIAERLRRDRFPVPEAVRLIAQVAQGLGAAHANGCVHADIKPSNIIMISPGPRSAEGAVVKILDFGIARRLQDEPTQVRTNAGTAPYLAPERTRGNPPDIRTDIWSLGVVLYEMLTGHRPFRSDGGRSVVDAVQQDEPEPVENTCPEIPEALSRILRTCLSKDPDQRYADISALLADLERVDRARPEARVRHSGDSPARAGTRDQTAYEHYLRGRYYADRFDEPSVGLARTQFQLALDCDPAFADAWAGLADTYRVFDYLSLLPPREAAARARAAAERALQLDSNLAAAHSSLATVLADYYWEWDDAERHFRRAVELDPQFATGHQLYAEYLRDMGRIDESLVRIRTAREIDPLSPFYQLIEGTVLMMARRSDEASRLYDDLIRTHPSYHSVHFYRGLACLHAGQIPEALAVIDEYDPRWEIPDALAIRGGIFSILGEVERIKGLLTRLDELSATRYVSPFHKGYLHLALGDVDRSLDLLEEAVAERNWFVRLLKMEPSFDPLRSHPRFQQILQAVGLNR